MGEAARLKRGRGRSGRCRNEEREWSQLFQETWLIRREETRSWQEVELALRKVFVFVVVFEDGRTLSVAGRLFPRRPEDRVWNTVEEGAALAVLPPLSRQGGGRRSCCGGSEGLVGRAEVRSRFSCEVGGEVLG